MNYELNNKRQKLHFWILVSTLFIISLILGVLGYERYYEYHEIPHNLMNSFYNTLQLFVLESGSFMDYVPLELNIARFLAPMISLVAILIAILQIFNKQLERIKISLSKNHIIVIGFGNVCEIIIKDLITKKKKIIIIDTGIDSFKKELIKNRKCKLIAAKAIGKNVLKKARILQADTIYLLENNDTKQINSCLEIYNLLKQNKRKKENPLKCFMHLEKQDLMSTLKNYILIQDIKNKLKLKVFNVHEASARDFFEEYPPDRNGIHHNSNTIIQLLVFGFGSAGEALALQLALTGHYINNKKPKIVIFDEQAEIRWLNFLNRYPTFNSYCDAKCIDIESDNPQLLNKVLPFINTPDLFTTIVLCNENETQNLLLGLQFDQVNFNKEVDIFIKNNDIINNKIFSKKVKPYGLSTRIYTHEAICSNFLDNKAMAFHNNYLEKRKNENDFGSKKADVSWEDLSQEYQDSNRKAADHIGVKMRAIGCEIVSINDPRPKAVISEEELLMLAKLEHNRWNAERSLSGWTYDKIRNDNTRKTPDLSSWEKLTKEIQEYDVNAVQSIPEVLASVRLKAVR